MTGSLPSLSIDETHELGAASTRIGVQRLIRKTFESDRNHVLTWSASHVDGDVVREYISLIASDGVRPTGHIVFPVDQLDEALAMYDEFVGRDSSTEPEERS